LGRVRYRVLPGRAWSECWQSVSWQAGAKTRLGVFELGWPKADRIFRDPQGFAAAAGSLRTALGLKPQPSVLYAPSWEIDGKQDDFVRSLMHLPVNLLVKQANWPEELDRTRGMTEQHRALAPNLYVIDPAVNILECLALADAIVSDESKLPGGSTAVHHPVHFGDRLADTADCRISRSLR
jgi:hypothetical protein